MKPRDKPTLAEFKRKIQPGVRVKITNHPYPHLNRTTSVLKAQSNAFQAEMVSETENPREAWVYWEKAANCEVSVDGSVCTMFKGEQRSPWITVEVVPT